MNGAVDLGRLRNDLEALAKECTENRVMRSASSKVGALLSALQIIEEARRNNDNP